MHAEGGALLRGCPGFATGPSTCLPALTASTSELRATPCGGSAPRHPPHSTCLPRPCHRSLPCWAAPGLHLAGGGARASGRPAALSELHANEVSALEYKGPASIRDVSWANTVPEQQQPLLRASCQAGIRDRGYRSRDMLTGRRCSRSQATWHCCGAGLREASWQSAVPVR